MEQVTIRMMQLFQIVTVLAAMQTTPAAPQTPTGTIRVIVTVAGTQTPIAGAHVTLMQPLANGTLSDLPANEEDLLAYLTQLILARGGSAANLTIDPSVIRIQQPRASPRTGLTDDNGEAVFRNLPPGPYRATAGSDGYVAAIGGDIDSFGSETASGTAEITEAQQAQLIPLALRPAATISGQVTDSSGAAVVNTSVALAVLGSQDGLPTILQGRLVRTDSRGNYRMSQIGAGSYYIRVTLPTSLLTPSFYPAARNLAEAQMIPVRGGEDIIGIDVKLPRIATFKITGSVLNAGSAVRTLYLVDTSGPYPIAATLPNNAPNPDGRFEILNIPPGTWEIFATLPIAPRIQTARTRVQVADRDVSGVTITSSELSGRFVTTASPRIFETLKVSLSPLENMPPSAITHLRTPLPVSSDGAFSFRGIPTGNYKLVIQPLPEGYSILEIRRGGIRLEGDVITVGERSPESLEVVLGVVEPDSQR
jgi:hypothetical protein